MDLRQRILNSRLGVGFSVGLGRILPPAIGRPFARALASLVASRKGAFQVRAVRSNQWVVRGEPTDARELDGYTREVFLHSGHCLYELYHNMRNPAALKALVELTPQARELVRRNRETNEGAVLVGPHTSNFDIALHGLALNGLQAQVLSYPNPTGGYRWQNYLRALYGLEITPFSLAALRTAGETLSSGGMVITGVDRPIESRKYQVSFFGRPASLPVSHIQLALNARVPVYVVAARWCEPNIYTIDAAGPIEMEPRADRQEELVHNAEAVLRAVEGFIRRIPGQWLMFYPVWPETMEHVP